ncbi:MAG: redoxin domain-containing protein [Candidatus Sulfotelmatobacter sp.]
MMRVKKEDSSVKIIPRTLKRLALTVLFSLAAFAQRAHPILAIGSAAPDFDLPEIDGKNHKLADYPSSAVLVVVFNCNHCPIAQMYERRVAQLATLVAPYLCSASVLWPE